MPNQFALLVTVRPHPPGPPFTIRAGVDKLQVLLLGRRPTHRGRDDEAVGSEVPGGWWDWYGICEHRETESEEALWEIPLAYHSELEYVLPVVIFSRSSVISRWTLACRNLNVFILNDGGNTINTLEPGMAPAFVTNGMRFRLLNSAGRSSEYQLALIEERVDPLPAPFEVPISLCLLRASSRPPQSVIDSANKMYQRAVNQANAYWKVRREEKVCAWLEVPTQDDAAD